jgi:hypothetical protein
MSMKRAGRTSRCTFTAVLILAAAGCATSFVYTPDKPVSSDPAATPLPLKVAVRPFEDLRGDEVIDHGLLFLVPFIPYGTKTVDRPERAGTFPGFVFHPAEDFPQSIVFELQQHRFFQEVVYEAGAANSNDDLIVTGRVITTRYVHKKLSYGLSLIYAAGGNQIIGLAGLPTDIYEYAVSFTVEMRRASDDTILWSYAIQDSLRQLAGAYYGGAPYDGFAALLSQELHAAMESLTNELHTRELSYWKGGP